MDKQFRLLNSWISNDNLKDGDKNIQVRKDLIK